MTLEIETMGDEKETEVTNTPSVATGSTPKETKKVVRIAKGTGGVKQALVPCRIVKTKDGKPALVTRVVTREWKVVEDENGGKSSEPAHQLIDAIVFEVVNGQPKLSAIKQGKHGDDWKWPHEE